MFFVKATLLFGLWWFFAILGVMVLMILIPSVSTERASAKFVFTHFNSDNGDGINSKVYIFVLGLLMSQYTLTGYDASAHMVSCIALLLHLSNLLSLIHLDIDFEKLPIFIQCKTFLKSKVMKIWDIKTLLLTFSSNTLSVLRSLFFQNIP